MLPILLLPSLLVVVVELFLEALVVLHMRMQDSELHCRSFSVVLHGQKQ